MWPGFICILCGIFLVAYIIALHISDQPRRFKRPGSEKRKYYRYMRKLGYEDWQIDREFININSYTRLLEINKELRSACKHYNL